MTLARAPLYPLAAAAAVALIVWVSLFPFAFRYVPPAQAGDLFWNTRSLVVDVAAWSLTDIASNAALFVPMGLFLSSALERTGRTRHSFLLVLSSALPLSLILEFGQAFVPWRAPSLLDVIAGMVGTVLGFVTWRSCHSRIDALASSAVGGWDASTSFERALLVYCGLFACAWLVPFDVTIRLNEIRGKYEHQRLLLPLNQSPDAATPWQLAVALVAAIPMGAAARVYGCSPADRRSPLRALGFAALSMCTLELAQVLVFSRTTDATELLAALPGLALGAVAAGLVRT